MLSYIFRRVLYMIPTLFAVTLVSFGIILIYESVSGTYVDQFRLNPNVTQETRDQLEHQLGLDKPPYLRYLTWVQGIFISTDAVNTKTGEPWKVWSFGHFNLPLLNLAIPYPRWYPYFGESFQNRRPVTDLFLQYLPFTMLMTIPIFLFTWLVSIPIGIYSATHQYSLGDHTVTFLGFLGLSIPGFFLALIIVFLLAGPLNVGSVCWPMEGRKYCLGVTGIFSQAYMGSPWPWDWSWGKLVDYLWHLWPVVLVLGSGAMATLIRIMRGSMLDILGSNYIKTAKSKGLSDRVVVWKHAARNAINPIVSVFGQFLPFLIQGALVTAVVLNIPTVELFYYQSLLNVDEYVIVTILMFFAFVLLIGNLLADILLAMVDPRIRYE
ncbi:ABC transporter permease [Candidatus Acetothermia bacterium]|nr:ABC transporter permease [Candidatus Acetothermia bacterium]MBI3643123.1 ABC transporter permease [Candidatus Acetothermia bacterium]